MSRDTVKMNMNATLTEAPLTTTITTNDPRESADVTREIDRSVVNNLGTSMETAEKTLVMAPSTAGRTVMGLNSIAEGHMNDLDWTLERFEQKYTMVGTYTWATSATRGTTLASWRIPEDILVTPALKFPFATTGYWRSKFVNLRVNITASPFYAGKLLLGFFPNFNEINYDLNGDQFLNRLIQLGGAHINVADNQSIDFKIPFRHYLSWVEFPQDMLGTAYLKVMNPLQTGSTNVNNVTVTVFVSLEGSEFKVPEYVQPAAMVGTKFDNRDFTVIATEQSGYLDSMRGDKNFVPMTKRQFTLNEPLSTIPKTMLCAGNGVLNFPKIASFADNPVDIVELAKRYRLIDTQELNLTSSPTSTSVVLNYTDSDVFPEYRLYALTRGGLNFKIVMSLANDAPVQLDSVYFTVCFAPEFRRHTGATAPPNLRAKNIGFHYFNLQEPAEFTTPYTGMTRVHSFLAEDGYGAGFDFNSIILECHNFSGGTVKVYMDVYAAVGDDFTAGYFIGTGDYGFAPGVEQAGIIENIGRAVENAMPLVEDLGALFNTLDAHPVSYQPMPIKNRKMGYTVANNQIQYLERLGLTNHNGMNLTSHEDYGIERKETDLYDIMQNTLSFDHAYTWNTTDPQGTIIARDDIGPSHLVGFDTLNPIDFFARYFNYWTGGITYIFEVVATQMHHGRLTLTFHPNLGKADSPTDLQLATQQYFTSFDLTEGRSTVAVTFPYLQKTPYRLVPNLATSPLDASYTINGSWALRVQNPLRGTESVSPNVQINVYKMAATDFQFAAYGNVNWLLPDTKAKEQKHKVIAPKQIAPVMVRRK